MAAARRRLNELNRELRIQLPVYLMVTKCDLVAGFTEYFDDLDAGRPRAGLGRDVPVRRRRPRARPPQAYPAEFDALIGRLNERLFARLEEERDAAPRHEDLRLPAADGGAARSCSAQFVDRRLRVHALRPADAAARRLLHERHAGGHADRSAARRDRPAVRRGAGRRRAAGRTRQGVLHRAAAQGRAVRRVRARRRQPPPRGAEGGGAARRLCRDGRRSPCSASCCCRSATAATATTSTQVGERRRQAAGGPADWRRRVARDACCRGWTRCAPCRTRPIATPTTRRGRCAGGCFRATSLGNAARDAYMRELDGALLPQVAARIRERLIDYAPEPEKLYEYLKAYLMLGRAGAPRQGAARLHCGPRVEEPRRGRPRSGRCALEAFRQPARIRGRAAPGGAGSSRSSRRRAARFGRRRSAGSFTARSGSATRPTPRAPCGSTSRPAWAPTGCCSERAGCRCPSRCRVSTPRRCSGRSPTAAPTTSSSSSPPTNGCGAKAESPRVGSGTHRGGVHRPLREGLHRVLGRHRQGHRARVDGDAGEHEGRAGDPRRARRRRCAGCSRRSTSRRSW